MKLTKETDRVVKKVIALIIIVVVLLMIPVVAWSEPTVRANMNDSGWIIIEIDASEDRGKECVLRTISPPLAAVFLDYVTDKITSLDWIERGSNTLIGHGQTPEQALNFTLKSVQYCTVEKDS